MIPSPKHLEFVSLPVPPDLFMSEAPERHFSAGSSPETGAENLSSGSKILTGNDLRKNSPQR